MDDYTGNAATEGPEGGYVPSVNVIEQAEQSETQKSDLQSSEAESPQDDASEVESSCADSSHEARALPEANNPPIEMGEIPLQYRTTESPAAESADDIEDTDTTPKTRRAFIVLAITFFVLAFCAAGAMGYVYLVIKPYENYDKIMPNVYCAGVNLGGMTISEAQTAIDEAVQEQDNVVKVILPDAEYEFNPEQTGVSLNSAAIAQQAYSYGRSDRTAFGMYKAYRAAKGTEFRLTVETELQFSQDDIQELAEQIHEETYVAPTDSTAQNDSEAHSVTITLGTPGREISAETITKAVENAFTTLDFSDISLEYDTLEIDLKALRKLTTQCRTDYNVDPVDPVIYANEDAHTIDVTMGTLGYALNANDLYQEALKKVESKEYGTVTLSMEEVQPADVDITEAYKTLVCDPVEPYYSGGDVQEGSDGYTLDWDMAVEEITNTAWGETVSIPMTAVSPNKTAQEVRAVLFRDQLSSFSSPHTANSNRTTNLTLSCKAINGTVINAGETFSFNNVVGQRTAGKGYKEATVYVGNESVGEVGGGICQVASTIYDAALYADLEITVRAPHTFFVTYVEGGLDATVYWGSQDFCFKNDTEYPIRVDAWVSGGYVHIEIYGTKTNDNYVVLDSTKLSTTPYGTVTEYTSALPSGTSREKTYPYTGYVYEAYQYVYSGDGTLLETNYLGKSTYKKRDRVIQVGTG